MQTPWGAIPVSDAHVHFFSHHFFSLLARQKPGLTVDGIASTLGWRMPPEAPEQLGAEWVAELDRHGIERAALIASLPGDHESVTRAVAAYPSRFYGYYMVNPTGESAALPRNGVPCFFPAMHHYSIQDPRAIAIIEQSRPVFVHCGVLSVGIRKRLGLASLFDMRFSNPIDLHAIALRFPQVRFIVPHFGAGYFREALMLCDLCPNVYLDTSSSNSWLRYHAAELDLAGVFRRALDVAGPKRLLFGTDSSFFPRGWHAAIFEEQVAVLQAIGVSAADARAVLHDNLAGLQPAGTG